MIATDPLSLLFIACFLFGLLFFIATALLGNLGHGASHAATHHGGVHIVHQGSIAHTTTHAPSHAPAHTASTHGAHQTATHGTTGGIETLLSNINITSVMLFLLGFGFFGYLFHNTGHLVSALTLVLAAIGGVVVAVLLLLLLTRLFGDSEGATEQDVSDRTGLLGKVILTIPENGMGEVLYVSPGGLRKSVPARSMDGHRLERGQEVVVLNYEHGVAEVDTWEHFINEEEVSPETPVTDELEKLRALLDESSMPDTQLVRRKDLQKE